MDQQVGQILADLTADGLANNTLIVFFADHGRSLPRGKRLCYDAGLRVPLLVRWPGTLTANIVRDDVISLIDLAPTMLSAAGVRVPNGLDGQILFGTGQSKRAREIAFAARDRIDEVTDTIRAARDRRFLYIRNDRPEVPYFPYCDYAEATPTLRELRRLVAEEYGQRGTGTPPDRLTPVQRQIMAAQKPEEELYDTQADPHCLKNLANDAKFRRDRDRLRSAVEKWRKDTNDLHRLPEAQLEARWKPNGEYPQCAPAKIDVDQAGMSLVITLSCPTPGASIAYTTDPANSPETTWGLYIAPLSVSREELTAAVKERGGITLRVRACRAGWADSDELSVRIDGKSGTASA
jgi:N-sulfoglucosamine sulfohydrolase